MTSSSSLFNNSFSGELQTNLGDCVMLNNLMLYNNRFTVDFQMRIWSFPKMTMVMIRGECYVPALKKND
jgi:kinase